MKFSDALYNALEKMPKIQGKENVVSPQTAKILAVMWNMLVESKIVLDDFVYINENNQIRSFDKKEKKEATKKINAAPESTDTEEK